MNGMLIAILAQAVLLCGSSAGFNRPSTSNSPSYLDRVSTEIVQKNMNLKSGGLILLDTEFGNVSIKEYDGSEVRVELKLRGTPEGISRFRFTHNFFGDQLTLKGWYENTPASCNKDLQEVEFLVMVPKGSSYAIRADTKQGNIKVQISGNMSRVDVSTEAGNVRLEVPMDLAASIDASTSELGKVRINQANLFQELCRDCEVRRSDRLKARMNGGGSAISAYSEIGSVYLDILPSKPNARS